MTQERKELIGKIKEVQIQKLNIEIKLNDLRKQLKDLKLQENKKPFLKKG